MDKYDSIYSKTSRAEEAYRHHDTYDKWFGHCLGGTMASILLNQPEQASSLTREELKGLWAELGENDVIYVGIDGMGPCSAGPPIAGQDPTDAYVGEFHRMLEMYVKNGISLYSNLRAKALGKPLAVWNHAIWKYSSIYEEAPGGNENIVRIETMIYANADHVPPTDDVTDRINNYIYIIQYDSGTPKNVQPFSHDWISLSGDAAYAPQSVVYVTGVGSNGWNGKNSQITEQNVRALDAAN